MYHMYNIDWDFRVLGTLGLYHVVITRLIGLKSDEKEGELTGGGGLPASTSLR